MFEFFKRFNDVSPDIENEEFIDTRIEDKALDGGEGYDEIIKRGDEKWQNQPQKK